jgi:transposase, IS6 family
MRRRPARVSAPRSGFAGYRFPPEVITSAVRSAVRWYLRFAQSYRDVEELLAERGIEVDHVSVFRWVPRVCACAEGCARCREHLPVKIG